MSASRAKRFLREMALDLDNQPDWIDPEKKRKISGRQDPFSQNPAWPQQKPARRAGAPYRQQHDPNRPDVTRHYGELVASNVYPEITKKIQRYTGRRNLQGTHPGELMNDMMQALMTAMRLEAPHKEQLERRAVELVLNLEEFADAREAVQAGVLRIDAKLVHPQEMQRAGQLRAHNQPDEEEEEEQERRRPMQVDPEEPEGEEAEQMGLQVPQIRQEYDAEAGKRRFINALIQGAAINKNYAYHEIADELRAINPNLLNTYGTAMSIAELLYWASPEQQLNQMMAQAGPGGTEELSFEQGVPDLGHPPELPGQEGAGGGEFGEEPQQPPQEPQTITTVHARGICFPVLIQEIVKGLYEFLSLNDEEPEDVRGYAHKKVDTLGNEQWDIMQGPGIWRHLNHLVNQANGTPYIGRIFHYLVKLPTGQFNEAMRSILGETPEGVALIQRLVNEIRQEQGPMESLVRRVIGQ